MNKKTLGIFLLAFLVVGIFFVLMNVSSQMVGQRRSSNFDYYWFYAGSRAILNGQSPYSQEVTEIIQRGYYGTVLPEDQYQHVFPFPAYIAYLFFPLLFFPIDQSLVIWLALQLLLLFASLLMLSRILELTFSLLEYAALSLICSFGFVYPMITYANAQLSILMLFLFVLSAWYLKRGSLILGGIILSFTSIRPDYFFAAVLIALIMLNNLKKLMIFVTSLFVSLMILSLSSFFLIGFWIPDWLSFVLYYSGWNPQVHWPPGFIGNIWLRWSMIAGILVWGLGNLWRVYKQPVRKNKLLASSAVTLVLFVLEKQTGPYYMTLLIIPAFMFFALIHNPRWRWAVGFLLVVPTFIRFFIEGFNVLSEGLVVPLAFALFQLLLELILSRESSKQNIPQSI